MNRNLEIRGIESVVIGSTQQAARLTDFSIVDTANTGYRTNGWVRRCISIIAAQASAAPWIVTRGGEEIDGHPLAIAFNNPHPQLTRTQLMKIIVTWLELVGVAPMRMYSAEGQTMRFGLINPNRIQAIVPSVGDLLYESFAVDLNGTGTFSQSAEFSLENTFIPRYHDPQNPARGIGTLLSASLAVDQDNAQSQWNLRLMQNKGRVDDIFATDQPLDENQGNSLTQRITQKIRGMARSAIGKPLVLSHGLRYMRMGLTPQEVDFINSRRFNREEIFGIFGVPVQLGSSEEASTFNNFSSAIRVLWEGKIFDVLNTVRDEVNLFARARGILSEDESLTYDTSRITALRDDEDKKAETASTFYGMGIPVSQINDKLDLGFTEYEGWDLPFNGRNQQQPVTQQRYFKLKDIQLRQIESESMQLETGASIFIEPAFTELLSAQRDAVFAEFDANRFDALSIERALQSVSDVSFVERLNDSVLQMSLRFSETVVERAAGRIETRQEEEFERGLREFLRREAQILEEISSINATTAAAIVEQVQDFVQNNKTPQQLRQAIQDTGITDPARAARIARTIGTNAASIGQFYGAQEAGATTKTWNIAGFATRDIHGDRAGETVSMSSRFSVQSGSIGPRWPGDADVAAADRINCRCFLTFQID